ISGNAQSFHKGRVIHHGTLLFNSNLKAIHHLLKNKQSKSKAIQSRPANTKNIKDFLFIEATTESFMQFLVDEILYNDVSNNTLELTNEDTFVIKQMIKDKYAKWEWNFGISANFSTTKKVNHQMVTFTIKKGIITHIKSKDSTLNDILKDALINKPLRFNILKKSISHLDYHHIDGERLIEKLCFYP
ncbi:MAG: hypothetical protein K9L26_02145, partial [Candidatus Izimaplasma sp.]|nr:hypothetical protein [Candidatus Izimaplasma bacterium]